MSLRPHEDSPHVVFAQDPPPWRDCMFPPTTTGQHFRGISLTELLTEPPQRASSWISSVYARLVVASSGPVVVANEGPLSARLERARWLRIAPDADAASARNACWPALGMAKRLELGVGSLAPDIVIVGERDVDRHPLFSRAGVWLFRALRINGYDELTVYVTNALDTDQRSNGPRLVQLRDAFAAYDPVWLALGSIPNEVLNSVEIEHFTAPHPSHARKHNFADGIEGYAKKLLECGLPSRVGSQLPLIEGKSDLAERLGIPSQVGLKPSQMETKKPKVPTPILDTARMKFVLGECKTIQEAAAAVAETERQKRLIIKIARQAGWEVERERFFAEKREKVKSSAAEAEAKRIGESRALAWEVTELMLKAMVDNLRKGDDHVAAKDIKAMNEVAIALSNKGDVNFDEERKRLASLAPEAFADELRSTLAHFGITQDAKKDVGPSK